MVSVPAGLPPHDMRMFDVLFHRLERLRFAATNIDDVLERLELLRFAAAKVGFPSAPWRRHFSCLKKKGLDACILGPTALVRARGARAPRVSRRCVSTRAGGWL